MSESGGLDLATVRYSSTVAIWWRDVVGSSFVSRGREIPEDKQFPWLGTEYGFWVKDGPMQIWLAALAQMIDETKDAPEWLKSLRNEWDHAAQPVGCIYTGLEEHVQGGERASILRGYVIRTVERLLAHKGDYFEAFSNTLRCEDMSPLSLAPLQLTAKLGVIEIGSAFARLLSDEIRSGQHDPFAWGWGPQ